MATEQNENDFYSKMIKPNYLLALKEITKLYGKDRVEKLLNEIDEFERRRYDRGDCSCLLKKCECPVCERWKNED